MCTYIYNTIAIHNNLTNNLKEIKVKPQLKLPPIPLHILVEDIDIDIDIHTKRTLNLNSMELSSTTYPRRHFVWCTSGVCFIA